MPVTAIPANYRHRLPRHAQVCYIEGPAWDEADECFIRIGGTLDHLAAVCQDPRQKTLRITEAEAAVMFDHIFQSQDAPVAVPSPPVFAAPSYLLPAALSELDTSRSVDLTGEMEHAMLAHALSSPPRLHDRWLVEPTPLAADGTQMVRATLLSHRFSGRSSGPVYTVWMDVAALDQAMPVDSAFEAHDAHTQRVAVARYALAHGAVPPVEQPEPPREVGIAAATREDDFHLVATTDPIYLRNEDVLRAGAPARILEHAIAAIEHEHAYLRAVMEQRATDTARAGSKQRVTFLAQHRADEAQHERLALVRESLGVMLRWYRQHTRHLRGERILCLSALDAGEMPAWRAQADAAYRLVVGVPLMLFAGQEHLLNVFRRPRWASSASGGSPPIPVGQQAALVA